MPKVLIADDDEFLAMTVSDALKKEHYTVELAHDGEEAIFRLKSFDYDLAVLDWEMPYLSGIEVCQEFRKMGGSIPILFLTGKGTELDKVAGLDSGADDYLIKPFSVAELCARLRALLRRTAGAEKTTVLSGGDVTLDTKSLEVKLRGEPVSLIPKELAILEFFLRHPGQFFSTKSLLDRIWSSESDVSEETLRSNISRLRAKLDKDAKKSCIETERGLGYKFSPRS